MSFSINKIISLAIILCMILISLPIITKKAMDTTTAQPKQKVKQNQKQPTKKHQLQLQPHSRTNKTVNYLWQ